MKIDHAMTEDGKVRAWLKLVCVPQELGGGEGRGEDVPLLIK